MSDVSGVYGPTSLNSTRTSKKDSSGGMSMDDFYSMLAAQLKYQDADNPMDTSEMVNQMVQTQMIQAITQMSSMNMTTYASSMVGKEATMAVLDEKGNYTGKNETGVITGVMLGSNPVLYIGEKPYGLSQLMNIGKVPEKPDDKDKDKDKDKVEGGGDGDK